MVNHRTAAILTVTLLMVVALSGADERTVIVLPPAVLAGVNNEAHGLDAAVTAAADPECDTCETPLPPPPCNPCEEPKEPGLTCNKAHAVQDGETCESVVQCAGLGQDDFQRFNPNICCDKIFVGQWVCLDATCDA